MTTFGELVDRIYDNVYSAALTERPHIQFIGALTPPGAGSSVSTVTNIDPDTLAAGDILEVVATSELLYVLSVSTGPPASMQVIRGYRNTTQVDQSVVGGTQVAKNPYYTVRQIVGAINRTLGGLRSQGIEHVTTVTENGPHTYEMEGYVVEIQESDLAIESILSVQFENDRGIYKPLPWRAQTTGWGLQILIPVPNGTITGPILIEHLRNPVSSGYSYPDDNSEDFLSGHPFAEDIATLVEFGATSQLLAATMAPRLVDPGRFTDRTIQAGQGGRDARWYQGEYFVRLKNVSQEFSVWKRRRRGKERYFSSVHRRRTY